MDWPTILDRFGVAVLSMVAMGAAIVVTARWIAKRVDDLIESHKIFLAQLIESQKGIHEAMGTHADKILGIVSENRDYLLEIRTEVKRRDK